MRPWLIFAGLFLLTLAGCATPRHEGNRVAINRDNVLVINGREVFPIGFTLGPPPHAKTPSGKNGLQELSDAGGTFIRTGAQRADWTPTTLDTEQTWEDAAAKHGLYCWPNLRDLATLDTNQPEKEVLLRKVITRFKNHPGLGIWKGEDEPQWSGKKVPGMIRARDVIRELDTNHPIAILQAPRGTVKMLRPYMATGDITGADIYPISYPPGTDSLLTNKEISMVGDYTRKMMEVSEGKCPVWMVLQIAWSGATPPKKTLRFPSFPEERFMTYQAIINGARGLLYFGGNVSNAMSTTDRALGWNWSFWNRVLRPVVEEVGNHSLLSNALVAPNSKLPITVSSGKGIEYCVRQAGSDLYLLACKREGATVNVKFSGLPISDGESEVMYESPRKVSIKDGALSDWFAPFDVHVYHFKAK